MASKAQKKQTQRYNEEIKAAKERMKNPTPQMVRGLENYCIYQIVYMNDAACNAIKFLEPRIENVKYNHPSTSKRLKAIYGGVKKRADEYMRKFSNSFDQYAIAELFGNMDEYTEENIDNLRKSIEDVLVSRNLEQSAWIASVETANILCQYAVQIGLDLISRLERLPGSHPFLMRELLITDILKAMNDLNNFVASAGHIGNMLIDLNKEPEVVKAFRAFNKAYIKPENFTSAATRADEENIAEGREAVM